ncbi:hypothetical protein [Mesorhizobium sp. NPDC059025]|uniref:hypothetical protein n=1 Tax=unclassified Mesorhizobium TaxID=325217 RepID=UPI003691434F
MPAVINSAPAPDIRRRFGNDDPVARDLAQLLERAISVQIDDSRLQTELEAMAQDGFLAGRGIVRLRFMSDFEGGGETTDDELAKLKDGGEVDKQPATPERAVNERITFEAISWRDYRHGRAKRWGQRPWEAYRHTIACGDYDDFADAELVASQADDNDEAADAGADHEVWEVWERKSRKVMFIAAGDGKVLKQVSDPLGLSQFYPIATPVQPVEVNGDLEPVNPFAIYRKLADELDSTTKRIRVITKQLKVKGWYGVSPTDVQAVLEADDNEFVPIADAEVWAKNGGLQSAVLFWPVEKLIVVLAQLYGLRDQTKQAIYEITGISDIVRGASNAAETYGAQQIKSQWGSLRIQKMQRMIERASRDLFVMMSEVIPAKFSLETLQKMTDVQLLPAAQEQTPVMPKPVPQGLPPEQAAQAQQAAMQEAQQAEQARQAKLQHLMQLQALMREKVATYYRIDVESDSTIRADVTSKKQEATEFMQASAAYFGAVGPMVQQGALPMELAVEIFGSFTRLFNLGKTVEDVLDELVKMAKAKAGQPQPNPQAEQAAADQKAKAENAKVDQQIKIENAKTDREIKQQNAALDLQIKNAELQIKTGQLALVQRQLNMQQFGMAG